MFKGNNEDINDVFLVSLLLTLIFEQLNVCREGFDQYLVNSLAVGTVFQVFGECFNWHRKKSIQINRVSSFQRNKEMFWRQIFDCKTSCLWKLVKSQWWGFWAIENVFLQWGNSGDKKSFLKSHLELRRQN